ncbi:interferon lambda receptor 1 [Kryptolebias marmoratus]|uniref:Uncharacterized LOC108240312 n=1 Tax=Kryptolebias marmoratus TaxID=37003 RepID=A0A3Q3BA35_KRYMA|nr:interferon lambda receptor 1 [Kryptolebias marmoratus]
MWPVNVMYLLLFCYACLSTAHGGVYFVSRNFYNVLHWDPVKPAFSGQKVFYSVQYLRDDQDQYHIKRECQNITRLSCNLTAETPSKPYIHYMAKVMVNGSCVGITTRFKPLRDTVLGPPLLSKCTTVSALHVDVILERGPNGVSIADIINSSKVGFSRTVPEYILKITHPAWAAQVVKNTTGQFDVKLKSNQTEYCGHVVYKPHEWGRSDSENASFCVTLPDNPGMLLQWLLVTLAVLSAAVIISVVCMCNYLKGGKLKSMPQALESTSKTWEILKHPDNNLVISEIYVGPKSDETVYSLIQVKSNVPPHRSGGYSPQDTPRHICKWNMDSSMRTAAPGTSPHSKDTSVQFSETYGVVAVHEQMKPNEEFQQSASGGSMISHSPLTSDEEGNWGKGGTIPKPSLSGTPQFSGSGFSENNPAKTLVLHTARINNGQLVLPSFPFLSEDTTGDTVSQMNPERKPLLSDLTDCQDAPSLMCLQRSDSSDWTDSGCDDSSINTPTNLYYNTAYFASQKAAPDLHKECNTIASNDAIIESGYKQNWMPEIQRKPASTDIWTSISPKIDEEVDDDEGTVSMENSGQIPLGHWGIQIQN